MNFNTGCSQHFSPTSILAKWSSHPLERYTTYTLFGHQHKVNEKVSLSHSLEFKTGSAGFVSSFLSGSSTDFNEANQVIPNNNSAQKRTVTIVGISGLILITHPTSKIGLKGNITNTCKCSAEHEFCILFIIIDSWLCRSPFRYRTNNLSSPNERGLDTSLDSFSHGNGTSGCAWLR